MYQTPSTEKKINNNFFNNATEYCTQNKQKTHIKKGHLLLAVSLSLAITGCNGNNDETNDSDKNPTSELLNTDVRAIISAQKLTGDPSTGRTLPTIDDAKAQLGMKLFFSKSLGGDLDSACVTCHHPNLGGGDDLTLPIGVDANNIDLLGPGRTHKVSGEHFDGGPTVPRNSPTIYNIALWDQYMFHDGRVESLGKTPKLNGNDGLGIRTPDVAFDEIDPNAGENLVIAQARFPVTSPEEMKNFSNFDGLSNAAVRQNLEQRLGNYGSPLGGLLAVNTWLAEFKSAFNAPNATAEELITFNNITLAIGAYESSQVFVNTPWKAYVQGDDSAISDEAKRGAKIFFNTQENGGANCSACHSGDFFTDEDFHVIAMAQLGRGKGNGENGSEDFGRFRESKNEADKYAFRTPSLLNVTATGPWGHAGGSTTLAHAIQTHLNPQQALDNYNYSLLEPTVQSLNMQVNTQRAIDKLNANRAAGINSIEEMTLTEAQMAQLIAFIETLTDPCVENPTCMSQWIPANSDTNPDDLRVNAVDNNGNAL